MKKSLGVLATSVLLVSAGAAQAEDVRIGVVAGLTGPYAFAGVPAREGMTIALAELNEAHLFGDRKIDLAFQDSGSEKGQAVTLINKFGADPQTLMVLGPNSSGEGVAIGAVANAIKVPLLTTTALAADITKTGPYAFKAPESPADTIPDLGRFAVDTMHVKKVAIVYARDNEGQIGQMQIGKDYLEKHGVQVVSNESILTSDTEFLALTTNLAASGVDAVYLTLVAEQAANLIIQARQAGLDPDVRFIGTSTMGSDRFIAVGGKAVEGAAFVADYFAGAPNPENKAFVAAFQKQYGHLPDNWAALGYTAVKVAANAIKQAGDHPTRDAVRDALAKTQNFPSVLGTGQFSFDADRNPHYGTIMLAVKAGKFAVADQ